MKRIKIIYRFFIILIFLFSNIFIVSCKNDNSQSSNINGSVPANYSIDKAVEVNTFDNLTKETGYYKFYLRPLEKVLNSCIVYAHDNYLVFVIRDSKKTIITDKSNAYIIEDNIIKEHRSLYNFNQNSFLIDIGLHDTALETTTVEDKIFDKYLASSKNTKERLKYLNDNFPEIFYFDVDNYEGLFLYYFLYNTNFELFGYNAMAVNKNSTEVIYLVNNTTKEISDEEKSTVNNFISLIKNYKE